MACEQKTESDGQREKRAEADPFFSRTCKKTK